MLNEADIDGSGCPNACAIGTNVITKEVVIRGASWVKHGTLHDLRGPQIWRLRDEFTEEEAKTIGSLVKLAIFRSFLLHIRLRGNIEEEHCSDTGRDPK
jgi:hypothetical protein